MLYLFVVILILILLMFAALSLLYLGQALVAFYAVYAMLAVVLVYGASMIIEFYRVFFKKGSPYVRTSKGVIKKVLDEINFPAGSVVYELGCADARFLRRAEKKNKGIKAIGYEYSLPPYLIGKVICFFTRSKVKIFFKSFAKADFGSADFVFAFLRPDAMKQFEEKFQKELKPGAMLISNTFKFVSWQPDKILTVNPQNPAHLNNVIYVYTKK